jgi:hypothetical protein
MNDAVSDYLASIGRKGGSKMTAKKLAALKKNAKRPRPGRRKPLQTLGETSTKK